MSQVYLLLQRVTNVSCAVTASLRAIVLHAAENNGARCSNMPS